MNRIMSLDFHGTLKEYSYPDIDSSLCIDKLE